MNPSLFHQIPRLPPSTFARSANVIIRDSVSGFAQARSLKLLFPKQKL